MEINHATKSDINAIMACITDAQSLLKSCGVDQWQDGYPTAEIISGDIERSESYLLTDNGEVIATVVISFAGEPTYTTIEGNWLNDNSYAVIHRLAVKAAHRNKGIAKSIFDQAEQLCLKNGINDLKNELSEKLVENSIHFTRHTVGHGINISGCTTNIHSDQISDTTLSLATFCQ